MMQSATRESTTSRVSESENPDPRSQTPDFRTKTSGAAEHFKARYQGTGMLAKCECISFTVGASNLQSAAGAYLGIHDRLTSGHRCEKNQDVVEINQDSQSKSCEGSTEGTSYVGSRTL